MTTTLAIIGKSGSGKTTITKAFMKLFKEYFPDKTILLFDNDLYSEISLKTCVSKRISEGGTGLSSIEKQIKYITEFLNA